VDAVSWIDLAGPVVLFVMMGVVGLELTVADFRRVARYPGIVLWGTLGQWTALPLAAAALLWGLDLEPHMAAGVIVLTAAPGGGISNVFTFLAGANTALSVTLTAVSSLLTVVVLPLMTALGFAWFVGSEVDVEVPVIPMIGQLAALVLLPVGLGMVVRVRRPELVLRYAGRLRQVVLGALVVLMTVALSSDSTGLVGQVFLGLGVGLAWTAVATAVGLAVARLLGLNGPDAFTMVVEYAVKNVGLAAIVALSGFGRPDFAIFAGSYILTGYPLAALAALVYRRVSRGAL